MMFTSPVTVTPVGFESVIRFIFSKHWSNLMFALASAFAIVGAYRLEVYHGCSGF